MPGYLDMDEECDIPLFAAPRASIRSLTDSVDAEKSVARVSDVPLVDASSFEGLGLDSWLVAALRGLAIRQPTAVQAACVPRLLSGQEVFAAAKTGSGKTAAFALPILHQLSREPKGLFALVLTPTRELAVQIAEQFQILGRPINASVSTFVGGMDIITQAQELARKPHVIVATPGRLADLLESGQVALNALEHLVFDEADRLLAADASFLRLEIPVILNHITSANVKWSFFSATMSPAVVDFYKSHFADNTRVSLFEFNGNSEFGVVEHLRQSFMLVPSQVRDTHLILLLRGPLSTSTVIIFTGKCKTCELVHRMLRMLRIRSVALHSQMPQKLRLASLNSFRAGAVPVLVTTDVGSRGLDIPIVDTVVNFDLPADARDYVHRVGRAARAGRPGSAISFVNEIDMAVWRAIEAKIQKQVPLYEHPASETSVLAALNEVNTAKREAGMQMQDEKFGEKREWNKKKWRKSA